MKSSKLISGLFLLGLSASFLNAEVLLFSKAYELALQNANDLKSSIYVSKSDKEKIKQEESQLYPQINLSGYYKKSEYVSNPAQNTTRQGLLNYTLSLRQSIYNPEIYARIQAQEARSKYSNTKVELDKEVLAQELFNAYLDLLKSKNKIELYKSYLAYNKSKLQELTKKYEMKLSNKMDLLQMRAEYNSAQIDLKKEEKLFNVYSLKLKRFIGNVDYELPCIDSNRPIEDMISSMREIVKNLNGSLKVKQAQIALDISNAEIKNARSGHFPNLNLDASYAKYSTDDPTVDAAYNNVKSVMLTLNIPIYSGGYVSSKVDSAKLMQKAAREDLESVKKQVKVEYDEYLALFEASAESVSMYNEAFKSAELYIESVEKAYAHGLKSVIDLNEAKIKLYEVKYKYIENIYEMVNSYIGLLIVTNNFKDIDILDDLVI